MLRFEWLSRSKAPLEVQRRALNDVLRIDPSNLEARYWMQKAEAAAAAGDADRGGDADRPLVITPGAAAA